MKLEFQGGWRETDSRDIIELDGDEHCGRKLGKEVRSIGRGGVRWWLLGAALRK